MRLPILLLLLSALPAVAGEGQAIASVVDSISRTRAAARPSLRFVWLPPGILSLDEHKAEIDLAMNLALGKRNRIVRGVRVGDQVLGYNLRQFDSQYEHIAEVWDSLALDDPVFHVPRSVSGLDTPVLSPAMGAYTDIDGNRLDVFAAELCKSTAPVLEARFLLEQMLGPKYYDFRQIKVGDDLHKLMRSRGYSTGEASYQRANLLLRSGVTGDQRVIGAYQGLVTSVAATVTYDLLDGTDEPEKQFVRNLDTFEEINEGSEIFMPLRNGLIEFVLADGNGKVVDEAPYNLAVDTTIPRGHDTTLIPAISCIACHTIADGKGMYRSFINEFPFLPIASKNRELLEDTFGETLDTSDGVLGQARREYEVAVRQITDEDLNEVHQSLVDIIRTYRYGIIDKEQAMLELGFDPADIPLHVVDDPEVALAIQGHPISRKSWNSIRVQLVSLWVSLSQQLPQVDKRPIALPVSNR